MSYRGKVLLLLLVLIACFWTLLAWAIAEIFKWPMNAKASSKSTSPLR